MVVPSTSRVARVRSTYLSLQTSRHRHRVVVALLVRHSACNMKPRQPAPCTKRVKTSPTGPGPGTGVGAVCDTRQVTSAADLQPSTPRRNGRAGGVAGLVDRLASVPGREDRLT